MGACHNAPAVAIGHALHEHATVDNVKAAIDAGHTHPHIPDYHGFDDYRAGGGYKLLEECLDGTRDLESILTALEGSACAA